MFSFHKNDGQPQSRQSSIDSPDIGSSTSTTTSDLWSSQSSGLPSHGAMPSPEQQHKAFPSKRSSVFNLRSRSNTAASMAPSLLSLSHPDMAEHEASINEPPSGYRPLGLSQTETFGAGTRKSLFRGKKGKRLSETVVSNIGAIDQKEQDVGSKRTSVLRKGRRANNQSEGSLQSLRHRISSPFDFQHLTHTDRHHFAALEKASGDSLTAGLWAVRASRPPTRGLTGIRADDLHFNNFSSENIATSDNRSASAMSFGSPPRSPETAYEWQRPDYVPQAEATNPTLRFTRSVESFSQPSVNPRGHRHSQSIVGPPRFSSLLPLVPISDGQETMSEKEGSTTPRSPRSKRESGVWDSFALGSTGTLPGIQEGSSYFGHALTTPDDSAIHAITPPFSPSLDDVAEEPERFISPRPAPQPPLRTPTTPKSPHFESFSFNTQRPPLTRSRARANSHTSPKSSVQRSPVTRPMSQMSETLGSTGLVRRGSIRRPPPNRRKSNTWRAIEESWEDDVDYIYENALEADCDFEWDRASFDDTHETRRPNVELSEPFELHTRIAQDANEIEDSPVKQFPSGDFRTSLLVPRAGSVPDLVPTSALSISTTGTGLATPSDPYNPTRFNAEEGYSLSPSLLVPQEYKEAGEVTYEDLLNEYEGSDRHFPMLDANQSATNSARSSHVRSSRRSSYDSSLVSSTQSFGAWSSPVRRSASSAGSVPELVPSRRSRKDLRFSLVVDQLSEQVASLRSFDEENEDDDITPPGRIMDRQAFFSSNDKPQTSAETQNSIQSELKDSLQLATHGSLADEDMQIGRQGSQRSTRAHHKQTLSESAAKLFATTSNNAEDTLPKSRNRSATTSHGRQPMLRLFPTPPRHTSTPTQI